jgi:putative SOS response-associated peptidase YedK
LSNDGSRFSPDRARIANLAAPARIASLEAMCGRYTVTADPSDLEQRFGIVIPFSEGTRRYNVAPTEPVVAVVRGEDGQPEAKPLRWGLIPPWAKDLKIGSRLINARSETAQRQSAFRDLLGSADRRALVLADGFFEWLRSEDPRQPRQPFHITVDGGAPFALAGLWTRARIGGEQIESVTILTTAPNAVVARLHDRMPVILPDRASEHAWLSPGLDAAGARALCVPLDAARTRATPANPAVNKAGVPEAEGPALLQAPAQAPANV